MNIFKKAVKAAKDFDAAYTEYATPKFRKATPLLMMNFMSIGSEQND